MTWIKICANTTLEDAQLAADLGADALGFVFAGSPRRVTPEQVAHITAHLVADDIERIGVFDTRDPAEIRAVVDQAGLTGIQLHAGLQPGLIETLRSSLGHTVNITQVLHWPVGGVQEATTAQSLITAVQALRAQGLADRVLIDAKVGTALGGTGSTFDWDASQPLFASSATMPLILAGGLKPENIAQAIGKLRPWGVDVASGVERAPGAKDPERLRLFLTSARAAG